MILDHSRHPRHFGALEDATHKAEGYNPLCGDRVTVYLVLDEDGRVADIKFEGKGCAISQASASMMTEMLAGRTVAEAEKLMGGFLHLVKGEDAQRPVGGRPRASGSDGGHFGISHAGEMRHPGLAYYKNRRGGGRDRAETPT